MSATKKIVFILGAGASQDCGAPLMKDFLNVSRDLLLEGKVEKYRIEFEQVFFAIQKLQKIHSKSLLDLNNIESIYTLFEFSQLINKLPDYPQKDIKKLIASLVRVIVSTLEQSILFSIDNSGVFSSSGSYGGFVELLKNLNKYNFESSILTFNYDVALDIALQNSDLTPYYGFDSNIKKSKFCNLFKLHGSLNWVSQKSEVKVYQVADFLSDAKKDFNSWDNIGRNGPLILSEKLTNNFSERSVKQSPTSFIVPPTWNKSGYHNSLSTIWKKAADELGKAEYIVVIGFSLPETDSFFKHLFGLGTAGDRLLRKFLVYNPDNSGQVKKRFESLLGPGAISVFEYLEMDFKTGLSDISETLTGNKIHRGLMIL